MNNGELLGFFQERMEEKTSFDKKMDKLTIKKCNLYHAIPSGKLTSLETPTIFFSVNQLCLCQCSIAVSNYRSLGHIVEILLDG